LTEIYTKSEVNTTQCDYHSHKSEFFKDRWQKRYTMCLTAKPYTQRQQRASSLNTKQTEADAHMNVSPVHVGES